MIEPREMNISAVRPTSRRSWPVIWGVACGAGITPWATLHSSWPAVRQRARCCRSGQ